MRHYELMVILDPSLDERTVAPSLDTFLNVIRNDGGKAYARVEAHLIYDTGPADPTRVDLAWGDEGGERSVSHTFAGAGTRDVFAGRGVVMRRVGLAVDDPHTIPSPGGGAR